MTLEELNRAIDRVAGAVFPGGKAVYGDGNTRAKVVLIGEAPGEQETIQERPFVGKAGKNLDEFLELAGLDRSELYVTNTVKVRPTKLSKAGNTINRPPTTKEIEAFLPLLCRELELIAPKYVVTLGNTPLQALVGRQTNIGAVHGTLVECEDFMLYPMYHPASLIYNRALRPVYEEDIRRFARILSGNL